MTYVCVTNWLVDVSGFSLEQRYYSCNPRGFTKVDEKLLKGAYSIYVTTFILQQHPRALLKI